MTVDPRDSMELRLTLRRLEAAEAALADARRSLDAVLNRQSEAARAETPTEAPAEAPVMAPVQGPPPPPLRYGKPAKPPKPPKPPVPTETKVIRAVAVAGSLITVAGVGLAVALAIQMGLLGPLGRVLLSTLLALALFGAGLWLDGYRHRVTDRDTAGIAAGVTALFVTSWLASAVILFALWMVLEWWPAWAATLALMAVWLVFLAVSVIRRLEWVAFFVGLSTLLVVPTFFEAFTPTTWIVALMPLTLLAVTTVLRRPAIRVMSGVAALFVQLWLSMDVLSTWSGPTQTTAIVLALLAMGSALAFATVTLRQPSPDDRADLLTVFVVPLLLLLFATPVAADTWAIWLLVPATVALAFLGHRHEHLLEMVAVCATAVAFVLVWENTPPFGAGARIDATIVVALFFLAAVVTVLWLEASEEGRVWPWAFWLGAALTVTFDLSRNVLGKSPLWLTDHIALVQAGLIAVFLGVVISRRKALAPLPVWAQIVLAVAGLHLSMVALVTAATWLGNLISGTSGMWLGYLVGHALVSILWMVLAAWILLAAPGLSDRGSLGAGMVLAVAGVVKLVFFDLGTLEGLPRAMAFLVSGVALLAMASLRTRRARPSQEHEQQAEHEEKRATQDQPEDELPGRVTEIDGEVHP
ncbi:MAG: DUF2339 domain-containing protein [Corynebacterium humireducens]|uniref:DUF2339 domain-containing protein n=1 Tax=Corynebacterium humireducens TaxID=1223514 RepID=A0A7X6PML6_9CORY|nr:DUF2339 domain-containing protein [Corynebacterium humireducens]